MMKMIFKTFARKFFGAKYERLTRTFLICLTAFLGLHTAGIQIQIAPGTLYLMSGAMTAAVMLQTLSSRDNAAYLEHMLMLPFQNRSFVFSYTAALGLHAFMTKTAPLLAIMLAVSVRTPAEISACLFCAAVGTCMAAALFSLRKYWYAGCLWAAAVMALLFFFWDSLLFWAVMTANLLLSLLLLQNADGYVFYPQEGRKKQAAGKRRDDSVLRYLFRYLSAHKNYLVNTAALWCGACVLPLLFKQVNGLSALPVGFAILSLNTPLCILISCDPALEQALHILPGRPQKFLAPYCLFLFLCKLIGNSIFLGSFWIQTGSIHGLMIGAAVFFALQSAVCDVLLEWFCPIRDWKVESDLLHHPRKYVVPAAMLLPACAAGSVPMLIPVLIVLLSAEIFLFLFVLNHF